MAEHKPSALSSLRERLQHIPPQQIPSVEELLIKADYVFDEPPSPIWMRLLEELIVAIGGQSSDCLSMGDRFLYCVERVPPSTLLCEEARLCVLALEEVIDTVLSGFPLLPVDSASLRVNKRVLCVSDRDDIIYGGWLFERRMREAGIEGASVDESIQRWLTKPCSAEKSANALISFVSYIFAEKCLSRLYSEPWFKVVADNPSIRSMHLLNGYDAINKVFSRDEIDELAATLC